MSLYRSQFEYHPVTPSLDRPVPPRPPSSSLYTPAPNYNLQPDTTPAVHIGHRTYIPPRQNDDGSICLEETGRHAQRNVAGYVKPGYTAY